MRAGGGAARYAANSLGQVAELADSVAVASGQRAEAERATHVHCRYL